MRTRVEIINELSIYTIDQWKTDGTLSVQKGQLITDEVYSELRDCVPPAYLRGGIFQVGEAANHDEQFLPIYATFIRQDAGWLFVGNCRIGETTPRKGIC